MSSIDTSRSLRRQHKAYILIAPVQEPACEAANERRKLVMNNEWALLDTLEVEMSLKEKEARERYLQQLQVNELTQGVTNRQALKQKCAKSLARSGSPSYTCLLRAA